MSPHELRDLINYTSVSKLLRSKQRKTPYPELWIQFHQPEINSYIQDQVDHFVLHKLYEYLIPETTQLFQQLTIMKSYKPQPTQYHPEYDADEDNDNPIWPKDAPPTIEWTNPNHWLEDNEDPTPQDDPRTGTRLYKQYN